MGKMNIVLREETERQFREAVAYHIGTEKGAISRAMEEAVNSWCDEFINKTEKE